MRVRFRDAGGAFAARTLHTMPRPRRMLPLRLRLGLVALLALAGSASCLSPTLPLPPPDVDSVHASDTPGTWTITGTCEPGALVLVKDTATGLAFGVEDRARVGS